MIPHLIDWLCIPSYFVIYMGLEMFIADEDLSSSSQL
jgi:hypothetical protein